MSGGRPSRQAAIASGLEEVPSRSPEPGLPEEQGPRRDNLTERDPVENQNAAAHRRIVILRSSPIMSPISPPEDTPARPRVVFEFVLCLSAPPLVCLQLFTGPVGVRLAERQSNKQRSKHQHQVFPLYTSVHSDRGPRAWGSGECARLCSQQPPLTQHSKTARGARQCRASARPIGKSTTT